MFRLLNRYGRFSGLALVLLVAAARMRSVSAFCMLSPPMARSLSVNQASRVVVTTLSARTPLFESDDKQMEMKDSLKEDGNSVPQKWSAATALASLLLCASFFLAWDPANAAMSGGRMGGSSFRSSTPSRSYSGGGGYRGSRPSSTVYYRSSPSVIVTPPPLIGGPMISPFGYGGGFFPGFGYGGAVGIYRGPSFFDILFWGGITLVIANAILGSTSRVVNSDGVPALQNLWDNNSVSVLGPGTSTIRLSVAMEVPNRSDRSSILSVLDRLASTARTDRQSGVQSLTKEVALEILRRKSSIRYATSQYRHFNTRDQAMREYNKIAIKERSKFERETVTQYNGQSLNTRGGRVDGSAAATMAVITLVLSIDGTSTKVSSVRSIRDVESALERIATDATVSDCLQGAEILWTPDDASETLSLRDVLADYPDLSAL
jgi:uncharacterized membrane protein